MPDLGAEKCKHSFILQYIKYDPPNSIDLSGDGPNVPPMQRVFSRNTYPVDWGHRIK